MTSSPTLLELSPVVKIDSINSPKTGRHDDYSGAVANSLISLKPATFLERLRHWYFTVNFAEFFRTPFSYKNMKRCFWLLKFH